MELFFDTETSGLFNFKRPDHKAENFPWIVQLGAILAEDNIPYMEFNVIIKPEGRTITEDAQNVHKISVELAEKTGIYEPTVARVFSEMIRCADTLVCHNWAFDSRLVLGMLHRTNSRFCAEKLILDAKSFCTMLNTTNLCRLPGKYGKYKWTTLRELHIHLFGHDFVGAHDAMFDIRATMKCYYELKKIGWIKEDDL